MRDNTTSSTDSQMDALIEGTDRTARRAHATNLVTAVEDSAAMSMTDALRDILREEARRDAARRS